MVEVGVDGSGGSCGCFDKVKGLLGWWSRTVGGALPVSMAGTGDVGKGPTEVSIDGEGGGGVGVVGRGAN